MSWFDLVLLAILLSIIISRQPKAVSIHVLPGGRMPQRQTEGAIGYDVFLRAIVSPFDMEPDGVLRKTLYNFSGPLPPECDQLKGRAFYYEDPPDNIEGWVYELCPGDSVLVGIGFISAMPFPLMYWVAPRSGLASKHRINLANAPGTVDPDYRGEAGVIVKNEGDKPFLLRKEMRIAQIIFSVAIIPQIHKSSSRQELGTTRRGSGGFGSTGGF